LAELKFPSISSRECLVLEQLQHGEKYGLELVAASGGALKRGTVYVTLGRMERKGFVESRQEAQRAGAIGLPRRLYRATAYGLKVLDAYQLLREALSLRPSEARG
jgi:PadR family transcriptional regulator, regulatory protein PadR